jgi:hypothetical protein
MGKRSGIRDPGSGTNLFRIPDPGVKKAPDPGSATLIKFLSIFPCPSRCGTGFTTSTALAGSDAAAASLRAPGTARTLKAADDGPRDVSERLCSRKETSGQAKRRAFTIRLPCSTLDTARYLNPVFENLLRSPGINSQPGGPVRRPYLSYCPASFSESIPVL